MTQVSVTWLSTAQVWEPESSVATPQFCRSEGRSGGGTTEMIFSNFLGFYLDIARVGPLDQDWAVRWRCLHHTRPEICHCRRHQARIIDSLWPGSWHTDIPPHMAFDFRRANANISLTFILTRSKTFPGNHLIPPYHLPTHIRFPLP